MEIKSISAALIFIAIVTILGSSIGIGEMADNTEDKEGWIKKIVKDNKNNDWFKKISDLFNFKKLLGFMSSGDTSTEDSNSEAFSSDGVNSINWICGNGKIDTDPQSTEECEPPNTATCDAFCHLKPYCGDGIINQASEQCEPPNTATCDAFCKIPPPELQHAFIDLGLDKVLVDPDRQTDTGDEYFDNLITECSFHSDESISKKVCLTCLLVDKKIEPCEDLFLSFTQFPHGTILGNTEGFPNAAIPGVTITAVANTHSGGGKNAAIIFDGDTPGDNDEVPTPDPDLRASGICPNCAGKHTVIIAENTAGGSDGEVDSPDDNAQGGTQTWVFDKEWYVSSFDFVDYDNTSRDGQARAYNNPSCSGTPVATAAIKASPNGGDGSVQTIFLNANNVRCLKFEYKDSGGVTNVKLECIKKFSEEGLLSKGELVLPDGYEASTKLSIPLEHGVDVQKAVGIKLDTRCPAPPQGLLTIIKFYDANFNGVIDPGEPLLTGWKVTTVDSINAIVPSHTGFTTIAALIPVGTYTTTESSSIIGTWIATTPTSVTVTIPENGDDTIEFGNVCTGAGGGKTPGFWTNNNGEALIKDNGSAGPELSLLSSLNLRDSAGNNFNPTTYSALKTWLQNRNAVNMAYMLSAHFAAMTLNVEAGLVSSSAQIYAPGIVPGDDFLSISEILTLANTKLGEDGFTPSGDPNRTIQEAIKNALDDANNNKNFVSSKPCAFGFS